MSLGQVIRRLIGPLALAVVLAAPAAQADAIPMPAPVDTVQHLLIGEWRGDPLDPSANRVGHGFQRTNLIIGNDTLVATIFWGIRPSNDYNARAIVGRWTGRQIDAATVGLTLTQNDKQTAELTIVFEGDDIITVTSPDNALPSGRFTRQGAKIDIQD